MTSKTDSISDLQYPLGQGASFQSGSTFKTFLNADYVTYVHAHRAVVSDWLTGRIGTGAPTDTDEQNMIRAINGIELHASGESELDTKPPDIEREPAVENLEGNVKRVYHELIKLKVLTHLKTTTSHRKWIRKTYEFCKLIGFEFSSEMQNIIRVHDMSKYTEKEALGYAIMFGDEQIHFKPLDKDEEKLEWQTALDNHYALNPHHPEYFYPKQENGERDKSRSMQELDVVNGKIYLEESLIDMLASRGERNLKEDPHISVTKWMAIPGQYMLRYNESDRELVIGLLDEWQNLALRYVRNHALSLVGHFDNRSVVE